jgi:hypothetical protein
MRSRRQGVSDAVSVLGMDPWKDDRVRDFVAINTIQRLRAYHLAPGAPMPPIADVNADRALNLMLLPRAEPDYRPCMGERPPTRAERRLRRREKARVQRRGHQLDEGEEGDDGTDESGGGDLSSSSSVDTSSSESEGDENGEELTEQSRATATAVPDAAAHRTPLRQSALAPLLHSPEVSAGASSTTATCLSTSCAIDRARALFFGAASFHSSTSPRRLVNSPHVPLTPSVTATTSPTAERQTPQRPMLPSPGNRADPATAASAPTNTTTAVKGEDGTSGVQPLGASRSLNMDLDAYIEANSTPLRLAPPPPLQHVTSASTVTAMEAPPQGVEDEGKTGDASIAPLLAAEGGRETSQVTPETPGKEEATREHNDGVTQQPPLDATPVATRPSIENNGAEEERKDDGDDDGDEEGRDSPRSCDVCDAIIQYYQSMLSRGVVLDRYNHKDLAFAWWVLGRNMDTAALESRGPMRREALLITIRNMYYSLLSAEEAKKMRESMVDAEGLSSIVERSADGVMRREADNTVVVKGKVSADAGQARDAKDMEKPAVVEQKAAKGGAAAGAVASSSSSEPTTLSRKRGRYSSTAPSASAAVDGPPEAWQKRPRTSQDLRSPESEDGGHHRSESEEARPDKPSPKQQLLLHRPGVITEGSRVSTIATRAHTKLPPMLSGRMTEANEESAGNKPDDNPQQRTAPGDTALVNGAAVEPLAAALRGEEKTSQDGVAVDDGLPTVSEATSRTSSATASRAGSVTPQAGTSSTGSGTRRRRRAEDRRRALEETWTSTRTSRRAASAKAAAELAQQAAGGDAASRRGSRAGKQATARTSVNAASKDATAARDDEEANANVTAASAGRGSAGKSAASKAHAGGGTAAATKAPLTAARGAGTATTSRATLKAAVAMSKRPRSPNRQSGGYRSDNSSDSGSGSDGDDGEEKKRPSADVLQKDLQTKGRRAEAEEEAAREWKKTRGVASPSAATKTSSNRSKAAHSRGEEEGQEQSTCPGRKVTDAPANTTATKTASGSSAPKKGKQLPSVHPSSQQQQKQQKPPKKKEEHRGRPRGSFKYPRPIVVDGVAVASPGSTGAATTTTVSGSRSGDKRREGTAGVPTTAAATFSAATAALTTTNHGKARSAAVVGVPASHPGCGSGSSAAGVPVSREMPLGLTAYERTVRARIQQRMGEALPPPPAAAAVAAPPLPSSSSCPDSAAPITAEASTTVYSSYTFLLSSFASHGQSAAGTLDRCSSTATTAPVLWYGPPTSSEEDAKGVQMVGTAVVSAARLRGRKKKAEGGVSGAVMGIPLRHDQAALELEVKVKLAREAMAAASLPHSVPPSPIAAASPPTTADNPAAPVTNTPRTQHEGGSGSGGDGDEVGTTKRNMKIKSEVKSSFTIKASFSHPFSGENQPTSQSSPQPSPTFHPPDAVINARNSGSPTTVIDNEGTAPLAPAQPPAEFSALTYAQQCLLVWTASGLLERHARRRHAAETRRERLLAQCGRMATRRMAARVAAAVESGEAAEDASDVLLMKSLVDAEEEDREAGVLESGLHDSSHGSGSSEGEEEDSEGETGTHRRPQHASSREVASARRSANNAHDSDESSTASAGAQRALLPPLPRRVYDYWAAYRPLSGPARGTAECLSEARSVG